MKVSPELTEKVRHLLERVPGTMDAHLGIEYLEFAVDRVVARMPVDHRTRQPFGLLHGGASVVLAESLCSIGALLNLDADKFAAVGIEINANHIRSVRDGFVTGTATALHRGRTTQVWEARIAALGELVCVARCTLAVIERSQK